MPVSELNVVIVDPTPSDYAVLSQSSGGALRLRVLPTGRAALHVASHETIDAWIINVNLPDMTGFGLHENLRERHSTARFVLVGDHYRADDERKARTGGAARYLCKPPQSWWLEHFHTNETTRARNG